MCVQVPDAVTDYFMSLSGYQSTDPRVTRIASLAAHKFVADLTNDALRICKDRDRCAPTDTRESDVCRARAPVEGDGCENSEKFRSKTNPLG